jgi:DNA replication protein DnaC
MNPQLATKLKQIRLSGMVQTLPARLAQAQGGNLTHLEFLELLVGDELAVRGDRLFLRRLKQAGMTELKDFSDFDWSFNPKLPRMRLCELATARFVAERSNVLLMGPPGVGKSHSVTAIAVGAIRAGYRVISRNIFTLADELLDAETTHSRRELVDRLGMTDLFVLEDFGMKTLRASAAEDLLDIITTNRPTEDWAKFLNDVPAATAILDRFLQHVEIIVMEGRSYRLANRMQHNPRASTVQKEETKESNSIREAPRSPVTKPAARNRPGPPPRKLTKQSRQARARSNP